MDLRCGDPERLRGTRLGLGVYVPVGVGAAAGDERFPAERWLPLVPAQVQVVAGQRERPDRVPSLYGRRAGCRADLFGAEVSQP